MLNCPMQHWPNLVNMKLTTKIVAKTKAKKKISFQIQIVVETIKGKINVRSHRTGLLDNLFNDFDIQILLLLTNNSLDDHDFYFLPLPCQKSAQYTIHFA